MENASFDIERIKKKVLRKYPAFGSVIANCEYQIVDKSHPIQTAGTDGKVIYMNKDYLRKLEEDEQVFVLSHEICHIGLNHILRSKDKDPRLWNIATDAVINRHLVKDGLPKLDNIVYLEEALNYDAEELYNKLLQDEQKNSQQSGNNQSQNKDGQMNNQEQNQDKQNSNSQNCNCQNPSSCSSQNGQQNGQNNNGQGGSQNQEQNSQEQSNQGQSGQQSQNDIKSNDNNQNQNDNSSQNGQNGNEQNSKGQKGNSQSQNKDTQGDNEEQNNQGANSQGGGQSQGNNNSQVNDYQVGHDEHTMWADALKDYEQNQGNNSKKDSDKDKDKGQNNKSLKDKLKDRLQKGKNDKNNDKNTNLDNQKNENRNKNVDDKNQNKQGSGKEGVQQYNSEKEFFKKNNEMKIKYAEEVMNKLSSESRGFSGGSEYVTFKDIGDANKPVVNWKKILKETLEVEDEEWGHRFSDKGNNYAARIQDVEYDEMPDTEIILDVSGSVSEELLRNFLRQVKTVLKNSHIKVGTFDYDFHGFTEIKNAKDIDNLRFYVGGGTNFDAASRAFTKRKDVNKICFTDGQDGGDAEIVDKRSDIIWITFQNPNFKPDYGKVIYVPESVFYEMKTIDNDYSR